MSEIGLWHAVRGAQPTRLLAEGIPSEKDLENWIFEDPTLLSSSLVRVRRQVPLGGKFMDLLAIEEPGVWVVCELKKTSHYRESLAQALDYVARLDLLELDELRELTRNDSHSIKTSQLIEKAIDREVTGEERSIRVVLAGTGAREDLQRMVNLLSTKYAFPISICTFSAVAAPGDDQGIILMRDISEDSTYEAGEINSGTDYNERISVVRQYFKSEIQLNIFDGLAKTFADQKNFFIRPWTKAIMVAPHQHHGRYLAYFKPKKNGVSASFGREAILEFFPEADLSALASIESDVYFENVKDAQNWAQVICDSVAHISTVIPQANEWNGRDWYFAFGGGDGRRWDDAVEFGFVSAGGGDWYSKTVRSLPIGARLFVYVPQVGYVGVGETTGAAFNYLESAEWKSKKLKGKYTHDNGEPEYIVPVRWLKTLTLEEAIYGNGLFASQHSACKLRDPKTLSVLTKAFEI